MKESYQVVGVTCLGFVSESILVSGSILAEINIESRKKTAF